MVDVTSMLEAADRNVRLLSTPSEAQRAAENVVRIAESYHAGRFVATSPAAAPIAATVTAALQEPNCSGESTLEATILLDVNFASGTEFSRAAAKARAEGAQIVVGLALYQLTHSGPTAEECGLDALVFVHPDHDEAMADEEEFDPRASGLKF